MRSCLVAVLLAAGVGSAGCQDGQGMSVNTKEDESRIRGVIDRYVDAVNQADAEKLAALFWVDDPAFSEVENDRPMPLGRREFLAICDSIRQHGKPGQWQRFHKTEVHLLSPDVAYTVSLREELNDHKTSRVTLVLTKRAGEWRIIHGHFSYVPGEESVPAASPDRERTSQWQTRR